MGHSDLAEVLHGRDEGIAVLQAADHDGDYGHEILALFLDVGGGRAAWGLEAGAVMTGERPVGRQKSNSTWPQKTCLSKADGASFPS
jgi:hypothetical protein